MAVLLNIVLLFVENVTEPGVLSTLWLGWVCTDWSHHMHRLSAPDVLVRGPFIGVLITNLLDIVERIGNEKNSSYWESNIY